MDSDPIYVKAWWALLAAVTASSAWFGKWVFGKIEGKADKAELVDCMKRIEKRDEEARESRRVLFAKLDETNRQVARTAIAVGRIQGQLGIKVDDTPI